MTIFFIIAILFIFIPRIFIRFSTLKIDLKEFSVINKEVKNADLVLTLKIFNKIPWLKLTINRNKIKKMQESSNAKLLSKILKTKVLKKYNNIGENILDNLKKVLKETEKIKIEKFNLEAKIGTESAPITAYLVGIISSFLAIILAKKVNKPVYAIEPVFIDKNYIYLSANCIITIKLVHINNIKKSLGERKCK